MKNKLMVLAFLASMSATSYADVKAVQAALDVDDMLLIILKPCRKSMKITSMLIITWA